MRYPGCQNVAKCDSFRSFRESIELAQETRMKEREADNAFFDLKENKKKRRDSAPGSIGRNK